MALIVKITTTKSILDWLCPHSCMGCGAIGAVLCECCKKDIFGALNCCPICHQTMRRGKCEWCDLPFTGFYMCGWRDEIVGEMVETYKYKSRRALAGVLAEMLDASLPEVEGEVVVLPLPTMARHVRERGFDHTWLMGRALAKMRGWKCEKLIFREKDTVQVGASQKKRLRQAAEAYGIDTKKVRADVTYLLLDDVWTTGASMRAAEKLLREAGAGRILGAVVAVSRKKG